MPQATAAAPFRAVDRRCRVGTADAFATGAAEAQGRIDGLQSYQRVKQHPLALAGVHRSGNRCAAPCGQRHWSITLPADGGDAMLDMLVALAVGFDPACYRLGDGDGLYDRTLAAMAGRRRMIGSVSRMWPYRSVARCSTASRCTSSSRSADAHCRPKQLCSHGGQTGTSRRSALRAHRYGWKECCGSPRPVVYKLVSFVQLVRSPRQSDWSEAPGLERLLPSSMKFWFGSGPAT